MYQIIAPTLFQNKICRLPGIGTLVMVAHSAQTDFVNSRIQAPTESIDFIPEKEEEKGFNEFTALSELLQRTLDESGSFLLRGIGRFTKDASGSIGFEAIELDPALTPYVSAKRVVRQEHGRHDMLVGDQQTTNVQMTEYYNEKAPARDNWWVWALVLAAAGIAALVIYYYQHGSGSIANGQKLV
jgi:hypothetical protein